MVEDPTPRELQLQLKNVVEDVAQTAARLERLADDLAKLYVPLGVYHEARKADERRFDQMEKHRDREADFRRQVAAGFIVGFLLILVGIGLNLSRLPGVT